MSGEPVESTPATNTRRRAADRRARVESSSSVDIEHLDATVRRCEESDSASYVRLDHCDSEPPRHANAASAADATLLIQQTSNAKSDDASSNLMLAALLRQMNQLMAVLATQEANRAADSRALAAFSDHLGRLERSRVDRGDSEGTEPQLSASAAPQLSSRRRQSRVETKSLSHAPRRCSPRPDEILRTTANSVRESLESRTGTAVMHLVRFLPPDRHAGSAATVLPQTHAAFTSLPPPPLTQPLPSIRQWLHRCRRCRSLTNPIRHSPTPSVSLPCSMLPPSQSYPNAVAGIVWDATDRETL